MKVVNTHQLEQNFAYSFQNKQLLIQALTHSSYANEYDLPHNQRLEFLGDAVLELVVTQWLYINYPHANEGKLTQMRAAFVAESSLAAIALALGLDQYILLGAGEKKRNSSQKPSLLSDTLEACLAAIHLDQKQQLTAVTAFITPYLKQYVQQFSSPDSKGELQAILQAILPELPQYRILDTTGAEHERIYYIAVYWQQKRLGVGQGTSKKKAELAAAQDALSQQLWQQ